MTSNGYPSAISHPRQGPIQGAMDKGLLGVLSGKSTHWKLPVSTQTSPVGGGGLQAGRDAQSAGPRSLADSAKRSN